MSPAGTDGREHGTRTRHKEGKLRQGPGFSFASDGIISSLKGRISLPLVLEMRAMFPQVGSSSLHDEMPFYRFVLGENHTQNPSTAPRDPQSKKDSPRPYGHLQ